MIIQIISSMFTKPRLRTTTGSFERVPQELLDLIISHLVDDKATLLSCVLVHTTWTRISRHHLPSLTLVVSCPARANALAKLLCSSRETLSSSIAAITLIGYPYESLAYGEVVGDTPRPYRKLIRALKRNENTRKRWRVMLWLASDRPAVFADWE